MQGGVEMWIPIEEEYSIADRIETGISIIIVSGKPRVLTDLGGCPVPYELIVDRSQGLGLARNNGARKAKNDLIVFVDDDVHLNPLVWQYVLATKEGEVALPLIDFYGKTHGCYANSRVVAIHKGDFLQLGGFDETLKYLGEDRDFYYRAVFHGLKFRPIPFELIKHINHPRREANVHVAIGGIRDRAKVFSDYAVHFPELFKLDFTPRIKTLQAKFLLLDTMFLLYFILKKPFTALGEAIDTVIQRWIEEGGQFCDI